MDVVFNIRYWCITERKLADPDCWKHGHKIAKAIQTNDQDLTEGKQQ